MDKKELLELIKYHNREYRKGAPEISDAEYDHLVDTLREIDPENEWFQHIEPVQVASGRKVKLPIPMKSLNKVKCLADLQRWMSSLAIRNMNLVITPKFDGLSLLYNQYSQKAYSRGGAENEGQDCTEHALKMSLDRYGQLDGVQFTFGELVFNRQNWQSIFAGQLSPATGEKYKSPRNTIAGLLNRDYPSDELVHADFFRYGIDETSLSNYDTYTELFKDLCLTFHQPLLFATVKANEITEEMLAEYFKEWSKVYYIDGLVIYIDDLSLWETIGRHQTTGNPLYAIAYKHPDFTDCFETTVKGISWKANKSGALKPVVNIEAVDTGDCNMENPTGYNAKWIHDHQIAKGAKILVTRSGGVIPKILETLEPASEDDFYNLWSGLCECPHCGYMTGFNDTHVELCCLNPDCPGKGLAQIVFFFLTCGAENVGEETFSKLYNAGFTSIKSILDITFDELIQIEGFGESIANTILENNLKIKNGIDLPVLIQASNCFKGIGQIKARQLLDELLAAEPNFLTTLKTWDWTKFPQFKKAGKTTLEFLRGLKPFNKFLEKNELRYTIPEKTKVDANGKYAGMAVCFTGVRDKELEEEILKGGGKIASGVSKTTTILIVKDKESTSSKMSKAKSLNIPIMTIEEFKKL